MTNLVILGICIITNWATISDDSRSVTNTFTTAQGYVWTNVAYATSNAVCGRVVMTDIGTPECEYLMTVQRYDDFYTNGFGNRTWWLNDPSTMYNTGVFYILGRAQEYRTLAINKAWDAMMGGK